MMDFNGVLAILGVVLAVYALAGSAQRKSIGLFVPAWFVLGVLGTTMALVISLQALASWGAAPPALLFALSTTAFLLPVGATAWAVWSWHNAKLTRKKEPNFRNFLFSCLHDGTFDEAVRILSRNTHRLAEVLSRDTLNIVFDRQFIRAMAASRSWIHLEWLTDKGILNALDYYRPALDRTIRELLNAEDSPLRTAALRREGGDETMTFTHEDDHLIACTFGDPKWYHEVRAGYPVLIAAGEVIHSGTLDGPYNQVSTLYGITQGIATRSKCPVFLSEKTIAHALAASIEAGRGTSEDFHRDAADLFDMFRVVHEHSRYQRETWDEPFGCGDYPTPFGFLLNEILHEYDSICYEAWRRSNFGDRPPPEGVGEAMRMWAHCLMRLSKDDAHVSPRFRRLHLVYFLEATLERRQGEVHATPDNHESKAAWTKMMMDSLKDAAGLWRDESSAYLQEVVPRLDRAHEHVRENLGWLRTELGLTEQ